MTSDDKSRREWLRSLGLVTGTLALGGGIVSAAPGKPDDGENGNGGNGPPDDVKNECPEGTALLAKYEYRNGSLVFEKGRDSLDVDGSEIDITVTATNEEGEILAFEWDASFGDDGDEGYDVHTVSVKAGRNVYSESIDAVAGSFDLRERDEAGPVQALSNVIFCVEVYWQVDFGTGDAPETPYYAPPTQSDKLILAATGGDDGVEIVNPSAGPRNRPPSLALDENEFDIDVDEDTATIRFSISSMMGAPLDLHLTSYETPGPYAFDDDEVERQVRFDSVEMDDLSGGDFEWTVDLPSL